MSEGRRGEWCREGGKAKRYQVSHGARARSCWGSGAGTYSSGRIARSGVETVEGEERGEESRREVRRWRLLRGQKHGRVVVVGGEGEGETEGG